MKFKKLLAVVLSVAMTITPVMPAFADDVVVEDDVVVVEDAAEELDGTTAWADADYPAINAVANVAVATNKATDKVTLKALYNDLGAPADIDGLLTTVELVGAKKTDNTTPASYTTDYSIDNINYYIVGEEDPVASSAVSTDIGNGDLDYSDIRYVEFDLTVKNTVAAGSYSVKLIDNDSRVISYAADMPVVNVANDISTGTFDISKIVLDNSYSSVQSNAGGVLAYPVKLPFTMDEAYDAANASNKYDLVIKYVKKEADDAATTTLANTAYEGEYAVDTSTHSGAVALAPNAEGKTGSFDFDFTFSTSAPDVAKYTIAYTVAIDGSELKIDGEFVLNVVDNPIRTVTFVTQNNELSDTTEISVTAPVVKTENVINGDNITIESALKEKVIEYFTTGAGKGYYTWNGKWYVPVTLEKNAEIKYDTDDAFGNKYYKEIDITAPVTANIAAAYSHPGYTPVDYTITVYADVDAGDEPKTDKQLAAIANKKVGTFSVPYGKKISDVIDFDAYNVDRKTKVVSFDTEKYADDATTAASAMPKKNLIAYIAYTDDASGVIVPGSATFALKNVVNGAYVTDVVKNKTPEYTVMAYIDDVSLGLRDATALFDTTAYKNTGKVEVTYTYIDEKGKVLAGKPSTVGTYTCKINVLDKLATSIFQSEKYSYNYPSAGTGEGVTYEFKYIINEIATDYIILDKNGDKNTDAIAYSYDGNTHTPYRQDRTDYAAPIANYIEGGYVAYYVRGEADDYTKRDIKDVDGTFASTIFDEAWATAAGEALKEAPTKVGSYVYTNKITQIDNSNIAKPVLYTWNVEIPYTITARELGEKDITLTAKKDTYDLSKDKITDVADVKLTTTNIAAGDKVGVELSLADANGNYISESQCVSGNSYFVVPKLNGDDAANYSVAKKVSLSVNVIGAKNPEPGPTPGEKEVDPVDPAALATPTDDFALTYTDGKITKGIVPKNDGAVTVIKGTKAQLPAGATVVAATGVKVNKKGVVTAKSAGTLTFKIGNDEYTQTWDVTAPKAVKTLTKFAVGAEVAPIEVTDLFGTTIDNGVLTVNGAVMADTAITVDTAAKNKIKVVYQINNKKYKATITVK